MKKLVNYNILAFLIVIFSLFLNLYGIDWGVPDKERIKLIFGEESLVETLSEEMQKLREEFYEKREFWHDKYPQIEKRMINVKIDGRQLSIPREVIDIARFYLLHSHAGDENQTLIWISNMNPSKLDFNPKYFVYGGAYLYPIAAGIKSASIFNYGKLVSDIRYYFLNPDELGKMFIAGRIVGALITTLATYLVFLIGFNLYGHRSGLIASLLFAVVPQIVILTHELKPHAPTLFWTMFSFYWTTRILKEDKIRLPILAGLFAGFSAGAVITSSFIFLFIPIAYFLRKLPKDGINLKLKMILISSIAFIFGFLLTNPYWLPSLKNVISEYRALSGIWKFNPTIGNWYYYLRYILPVVLGVPFFIFIILSIIYAFYKREKQDILILPLVILMLIYFASFDARSSRLGISLAPFFVLLVARFFDAGLSNNIKWFKLLTYIFLLLVIFCNFIYSFSHDKICAQKNIRIIAGEWINNNIPPGVKIGLFELPSLGIPPFNLFRYNLKITGFDKILIEKNKPEYFIFSESECEKIGWTKTMELLNNYREIKKFEKLQTFLNFEVKKSRPFSGDWANVNPVILIFKRK